MFLICRKPTKRHAYVAMIFLFSILVPPLAVFLRFGIGFDFFVNVLLTIAGYFPGHVRTSTHTQMHNFFIQDRTPKWLKKLGVVDNKNTLGKDRKWAERYINSTRAAQYDENGFVHYLDEDDDVEATAPPSDGLVEPDRYINEDRRRRRSARRTSDDSLTAAGSGSAEPVTEPWSGRAPKTLRERTMKLLGKGSGASRPAPPIQPLDRHSRVQYAEDRRRRTSVSSAYGDFERDPSYEAPAPYESQQPTMPVGALDDLDRELMGLSTDTNYPPVRSSRRTAAHGSQNSSTSHDMSQSTAPAQEPQRDVLDYNHVF